jgi:hypothetical protein
MRYPVSRVLSEAYLVERRMREGYAAKLTFDYLALSTVAAGFAGKPSAVGKAVKNLNKTIKELSDG